MSWKFTDFPWCSFRLKQFLLCFTAKYFFFTDSHKFHFTGVVTCEYLKPKSVYELTEHIMANICFLHFCWIAWFLKIKLLVLKEDKIGQSSFCSCLQLFLFQLLRGLAYIHKRKILHRWWKVTRSSNDHKFYKIIACVPDHD